MDNILSWVKAVLAVTPETWRRLTRKLPPELLTAAPAPGQWSALECLQHLIDTERVFHFRLGCVLEGKDFPAFNPDTQGKTPDRSRQARGARRRVRTACGPKALQALSRHPGDRAGRSARHQELGSSP